MKCDQVPSILDVANALVRQCQSTTLVATATPTGSKGSLGRGQCANSGTAASIQEAISLKCKTEIRPVHAHGLYFQVKGSWRTPHRSLRGKDNTGEVVPLGEICWGRYHSEDGAKLNVRWMRGVFVGKLDSINGFILLTPTGATKTRCVRRIEGNSAWDLQFLNFCVGGPWNVTAKSSDG